MDETPKGWYIQYIDRDPETIRRQQEQERKKKQDLDDEEKTAKFIEQQVRRGLEGKEVVRKITLCVNLQLNAPLGEDGGKFDAAGISFAVS